MFRRKKKSEPTIPDGADTTVVDAAPPDPHSGAPDPASDEAGTVDPGTAQVADAESAHATDGAVMPEPGHPAIAFAEMPSPAVQSDPVPDDINPDSAAAVQRRQRYAPSDGPLAAPHGGEEHLPVSFWVGSVQSVLTKSGRSSAEDREREAAADFQAAIMPGLMGLRDAVPDAASPDDALRVLAEREADHEYPEDPEALSLSQRDIFRTDASVYYRIRNRFDKPRRRVGWNNPWRPPPGLARPDPPHRALDRGE